jgi:hypothetical protein
LVDWVEGLEGEEVVVAVVAVVVGEAEEARRTIGDYTLENGALGSIEENAVGIKHEYDRALK